MLALFITKVINFVHSLLYCCATHLHIDKHHLLCLSPFLQNIFVLYVSTSFMQL
jgi:hypothetical protein